MGDECGTPCPVCNDDYGRFRSKYVYTLDEIKKAGDSFRVYVQGGGSYLHTMVWGSTAHHCSVENDLPISANTSFRTFISEIYMDNESPKIPYFISDDKHPRCLAPAGVYSPAPVVIKALDLHFIYQSEGGNMSPVFVVPLDPQYFAQMPALRFGVVDKIELTPEALRKFVLEKCPSGTDVVSFVGRKACVIDIRLSFALENNQGYVEQDKSLFDGTLFSWPHGEVEPRRGSSIEMFVDSDYLFHLRTMIRPLVERVLRPRREFTPESMSAQAATPRADARSNEKALFLIMQGLGLLAQGLDRE